MSARRAQHVSAISRRRLDAHEPAVQAVLIASIGASREARSAGYQPNNIPTSIENSTAEMTAE
jgi:hypothetical protein